ncbi:phage tail protein [Parerythrobacter lacustris]|uniref:Tail fiber protein n=1 Tax=Parerythrobacter lacustris TaxID=2969984 RepID=A0ABT1XTF5_9SPHN|nr:tail fiber protein [Parerythrobacter lacustris]MCR2834539.1 tail fiber protein [Parerythrobacter lacustris]
MKLSKTTLASGVAAITLCVPTAPAHAGTDAYIGEITPMAFSFCPRSTLPMNGQILSIASNTALFSLLGTTYGGNGQTTFALPNLQGRVPMHFGNGPGLTPRVLGEVGGTETNTLLSTQMPAHTHTALINVNNTATADSGNPTGNVFARAVSNTYENTDPPTPGATMAASTVSVSTAGGSQPFNNIQPYLVLNYCIVTQGIFPPRN